MLILEVLTIALLILCTILATPLVIDVWKNSRVRKKVKKKNPLIIERTIKQNQTWLTSALHTLNCKVEWIDEKENKLCHFEYQDARFDLRLNPETPYATLFFPHFLDTPQDNIELVRSLCNVCNLNTDTERIVYTYDKQHNTIDVHIITGLLVNKQTALPTLANAMANCFQWRNAIVKKFDELLKEKKNEKEKKQAHDPERSSNEWNREVFLLHEQEIMHQDAGPDWRQNHTQTITLQQVLSSLAGITRFLPIRMLVISNGKTERVPTDDIKDFDLSQPLINNDDFTTGEAIISLTYRDQRRPDKERSLAILLKTEGKGEHTLYYRITLTVSPLSAQPIVAMGSQEQQAIGRTALIGYDLQPADGPLSEFRYMWKDACQKLRNGKDNELSEEQRLIASTANEDAAYELYFGHKFFLDARYLEASLHLENAWRLLQADFAQLKDSKRRDFYEICYYLGFCFNELQQYEKANFYLEQALPMQRVVYTEEYVNCLVNSHDFRAIPFITNLLAEIEAMEENNNDDDNTPDIASSSDLTAFKSFLRRRKAYALIETRQYNEAEHILKTLLDDPDSSDFALNELAHLQKLKK